MRPHPNDNSSSPIPIMVRLPSREGKESGLNESTNDFLIGRCETLSENFYQQGIMPVRKLEHNHSPIVTPFLSEIPLVTPPKISLLPKVCEKQIQSNILRPMEVCQGPCHYVFADDFVTLTATRPSVSVTFDDFANTSDQTEDINLMEDDDDMSASSVCSDITSDDDRRTFSKLNASYNDNLLSSLPAVISPASDIVRVNGHHDISRQLDHLAKNEDILDAKSLSSSSTNTSSDSKLSIASYDTISDSSDSSSESGKTEESSLLSSEYSSDSSIFDDCTVASDVSDGVSESEEEAIFIGKELRLKRKFELREKVLKKVSMGNTTYKSFLLEEERLVQSNSHRRLQLSKRAASMGSRMSSISESIQECNHEISFCTESEEGNEQNTKTIFQNDGEDILQRFKSSHTVDSESMPSMMISKTSNPSMEPFPSRPFAAKLRHTFAFEKYHTAPGITNVIFYCIAHQSIFELLQTVHTVLFSKLDFFDTSTEITMTVLVGLVLSRMCGGIFYWLQEDFLSGAKFALHNRLRLGHADAVVMKWIKKHETIAEWVDIVGFYLVAICVARTIPCLLWFFDLRDSIVNNLPSNEFEGLTTWSKNMLDVTFDEWSFEPVEDLNESSEAGHCILNEINNSNVCFPDSEYSRKWLEFEDYKFVEDRVSNWSYLGVLGEPTVPLVSTLTLILFHSFWLGVSTYGLRRGGLDFWNR